MSVDDSYMKKRRWGRKKYNASLFYF